MNHAGKRATNLRTGCAPVRRRSQGRVAIFGPLKYVWVPSPNLPSRFAPHPPPLRLVLVPKNEMTATRALAPRNILNSS